MVIGSGLIGSAFEKSQHEFKDSCVYASGVSNSNSSDCYEFKREQDQLVYFLSKYRNLRRFYFISTCSLYDSERNASPYVKHKLNMENLVISNTNGVVIRLPQVVGRSTNPYTITNFIYLSPQCDTQIMNALKRENYQRNSILKGLVNSQEDDLVIISDLDEIPDPISFKYFTKADIEPFRLALPIPDLKLLETIECKYSWPITFVASVKPSSIAFGAISLFLF